MKILDNLKQIMSHIKNLLFRKNVPMIEATKITPSEEDKTEKENNKKSFIEKLQEDYMLDTPEKNDDLASVQQYAYILNNNIYSLPKYIILTKEFDNYPSHIIGKTRYFDSEKLSIEQKFELIDKIVTQLSSAIIEFISINPNLNTLKEKHKKITTTIDGSFSLYKFQLKNHKSGDLCVNNLEHGFIDLINLSREIENEYIPFEESSLEH